MTTQCTSKMIICSNLIDWMSTKTLLLFSQDVFWPAAPCPASHQTPAGVSSWWSPFHEWLGCILSATRLLERKKQKNVQFRKCLCDIWMSATFTADLGGCTDKKVQKLRNDACYGLWSALYWLWRLSNSRGPENSIIIQEIKTSFIKSRPFKVKHFDRKLQSRLWVSTLILDKPEVRIQSTPQ